MAGLNAAINLPQALGSTFAACTPEDDALLESCVLQPAGLTNDTTSSVVGR
jgi:hypothetical protein